jgi:hypothetical protein
MLKRVASYVVRILSGASPGELLIERPSKFEFVIKTTKTHGLGRADEAGIQPSAPIATRLRRSIRPQTGLTPGEGNHLTGSEPNTQAIIGSIGSMPNKGARPLSNHALGRVRPTGYWED